MQLPRATRLVVRIAGKRMYLWRAVDHEGEVLDMLVQRRREYAGGTPADAQAQETGLRTEVAGHRQAGLLRHGFSGSCASPALMSAALEETIALKTPVKSCGDE